MSRVSVLIIDDEELDRYLLKRDLSRTGIEAEIFECGDGEEALGFFTAYDENKQIHGDSFPPVVIFLDINMPRVNGFEFLSAFAKLREERPDYTSCVIMMFSTSARPDEQETALTYDFVKDFIVKGETDANILGEKIRAFI